MIQWKEISKTEFTNMPISGHLGLCGVRVPHWGAAAFQCPGDPGPQDICELCGETSVEEQAQVLA